MSKRDIDPMRVVNFTVHNCARIRIQADPENGCVDIYLFDENNDRWTAMRILAFGPDDTTPGIDLAEPAQPEPEEEAAA